MEHDPDRFSITGTTIKSNDSWLWIKVEGRGATGLLKASPVTGSCVYAGDMILEEGWKTVSFNFSCRWGDADSDAEVEEAAVKVLERQLADRRTQLKLSQLEERVRTLTIRLEKEMDVNAALNMQLHLMGELRGE